MTANQHSSSNSTPTSIDKEGKYQYVRVSAATEGLSGSLTQPPDSSWLQHAQPGAISSSGSSSSTHLADAWDVLGTRTRPGSRQTAAHGITASGLAPGMAFPRQQLTFSLLAVLQDIGTGSFGQVLLAKNVRTNEQVSP